LLVVRLLILRREVILLHRWLSIIEWSFVEGLVPQELRKVFLAFLLLKVEVHDACTHRPSVTRLGLRLGVEVHVGEDVRGGL